MSGTNPFRRKPPLEGILSNPYGEVDNAGAEARFPALDTDVPRPLKAKTVRIISPHASTSNHDTYLSHDVSTAPRTIDSPFPNTESAGNSAKILSIDPFSIESDDEGASTEDEDLRQNTIDNAGPSRPKAQVVLQISSNPFQRNPNANIDESSLGSAGEGIQQENPKTNTSYVRPHYDVDEFKRLLLTGEQRSAGTVVLPTPPLQTPGTQNIADSNSNTDASSISRQSIFEPLPGIQHDTPRTSHEVSPSGDEWQEQIQIPSPSTKRTRTLAPDPQLGSIARGNVPQTVSFKDPTLSFPAVGIATNIHKAWPAPNSPRTPTDLNKPLPPPPTSDFLDHEATASDSSFTSRQRGGYFEPYDVQANSSSRKRNPPTPPLARRHSQIRPKSFASSLTLSKPISEENLSNLAPFSRIFPIAGSKPPPPPPPRRSGQVHDQSTSNTTWGIPSTPDPSIDSAPEISTIKAPKSRPPVPPTRSPSVSSSKRPTRFSMNPGSATVAPPPPPRRQDSSHSSFTWRRSSGEYGAHDSERHRSDSGASSIPPASSSPSGPSVENKDVLADLNALQREVDELRWKFKG